MALALALLLATPTAAAEPSAGEREAARTLLLAGREKRRHGQNKEALADFEKAHAIMHVPTTGLDLGRTQEALGLLVEARSSYLESARFPVQANEPTSFKRAREEAKTRADALGARLATLTVTAPGAEKVMIDEVELAPASVGAPLKVNPGSHTVIASSSRGDKKVALDLGEGETKALDLDMRGTAPPATTPLPPPVAPRREPPATQTNMLVWVGGAVLVVGAAAGTVTGILTFRAKSDVKSRCLEGTKCPTSEDDNIDRGILYGNLSTVSFIVAGAGLGALVYGLLNPTKIQASAKVGLLAVSPFGVSGLF